jgi:hypothetical protein
MLAAGLPSGFTTDGVSCWGEPCGEPAISLHSHYVSPTEILNHSISKISKFSVRKQSFAGYCEHSRHFNLTLSTRDHFFLEFASFLHSVRPLDIRDEGPVFILAKFGFSAELQHPHDRVASVFADHFIPL